MFFASVLTSPCISLLTMQFLQSMFANTSCRHSLACQVKTVKSVKLYGFCKVYFLYGPCKSEDHASNSSEESRHQSLCIAICLNRRSFPGLVSDTPTLLLGSMTAAVANCRIVSRARNPALPEPATSDADGRRTFEELWRVVFPVLVVRILWKNRFHRGLRQDGSTD